MHAGSFKTRREAKQREQLVAGELAAGRNPADALSTLSPPRVRRTLSSAFEQFEASRADVSASTLSLYAYARNRLRAREPDARGDHGRARADVGRREQHGERRPPGAGPEDARALPLDALRHVLDFCGIEPNPARAKSVKLPKRVVEEVAPPNAAEWEATQCRRRRGAGTRRLP
jgi:hypothetical protein